MVRSKKKLYVYYLSNCNYGGWVSYTQHLLVALQEAGVDVELIKVGRRTEHFTRVFCKTSFRYRNVSLEDLSTLRGRHLVVVLAKQFREAGEYLLKKRRARIIVHDAVEGRFYDDFSIKRPILVRANLTEHYPDGIYIPQPYRRLYAERSASELTRRSKNAVSLSRIDFDKNTDILLRANKILGKKFKIDVKGFENRLYTKFNIIPEFPDWKQSVSAFSNEINSGAEIARNYNYMVDLTEIKGDGGGTQYTYMEAMDAGTVCIIHSSWLDKRGPMSRIGTPVGDHKELASLLRGSSDSYGENIEAGYRLLRKHAPRKVGTLFRREIWQER